MFHLAHATPQLENISSHTIDLYGQNIELLKKSLCPGGTMSLMGILGDSRFSRLLLAGASIQITEHRS